MDMQYVVLKHNGIQTNQRIKFVRYGSQCKHKIVFEYHSSIGGNVEKTKIVFPYYDHHKKSLLRRGLFMTKCFSKVKTFSSFWMFSVTAEKVGEVEGDGCSRSV